MAKKNFMSYGDSESLFAKIQERLGLRPKTWSGTQEEWDALTLAEKKSYDRADITDDSESGDVDTVPTKDSPNLITSGGVFDGDKTVFEVMGKMGAKNLILYPCNNGSRTNNGITFTDNGDGTVTANGTATADAAYNISQRFGVSGGSFSLKNGNYLLSGCESGSNTTFFIQAGVTKNNVYSLLNKNFDGDTEITVDGDDNSNDSANIAVQIVVRSGQTLTNKVFKPMIRLASITDDTYEPYAKTNQQLTENTTLLLDNLEVNGAVNILENLVIARVSNGITATLNEDGTITLQSDGTTRTETTDFAINCLKGASYSSISGTINYEDGKTYYGSGCPKVSGVRLRFSATASSVVDDSGDGCKFTYVSSSSNKGQVYIRISASADLTTPITVKPMITVAPYGDYVPYAMSNKELTKNVTSLDAMYDGKTPSAVSDLNVPLTAGGASVALTRHLNNTTNAPTTGGGLEITWSSSDKYGAQLTLTDSGLYFRTNNNGTISAWQKIST